MVLLGKTLYDLYGEAYTPWEWQLKLKRFGDGLAMDLFSSAFAATAVDFLEEMGVPVQKVASFELVNSDHPRMARSGKPLSKTGREVFYRKRPLDSAGTWAAHTLV